jgi:two-component system LytT family response regulator
MMRCLIVDDEPLALDILEHYIRRVPHLHLVRRCRNALEAYDTLQREAVDLIFLDIHMPELTGIDFVKSLSVRPLVIFTTAYSNYAMEGFNLDVLDYLLKPIAFDRFLKAVDKARRQLGAEAEPPRPENRQEAASASSPDSPEEFLFVKSEGKMVKVRFDEVLFVEGMKDYVQIQMTDQRLIVYQTMKNMEKALPPDRFLRIHKSYLVAVDKIESLDGNLVEVGKHRLSVGASYRDDLLRHIQRHNLPDR